MKVCLACDARFDADSWVCPACSRAPVENGFVMFAPELAASIEHFPSEAVGELAPREELYFWFTARNALISALVSQEIPNRWRVPWSDCLRAQRSYQRRRRNQRRPASSS